MTHTSKSNEVYKGTNPARRLLLKYIFSVLPGGVETWLGYTCLRRFNIKCHKMCWFISLSVDGNICISHVLRRQSKHFLGQVSKIRMRVRGIRCFFNPTKSVFCSAIKVRVLRGRKFTYFFRRYQFYLVFPKKNPCNFYRNWLWIPLYRMCIFFISVYKCEKLITNLND